ncbi:M96 mating-specific protein family [Phytophthora cinnamomi]|uniref:M96 mating-specific protein family n=1 Tax=Phytophthora cinnamomi TaxID=4785 RepID=UPI003559FC3E|nr:M96 mating-specific protein family [Phytophthora cinnamomi]
MEPVNTSDQVNVNASASMALLDDPDLLQEITAEYDVEDALALSSNRSTPSTDAYSPNYDVSTDGDRVGLTPDEVSALLQALDASDSTQTSPLGSTTSRDIVAQISAPNEPKPRRRPGRKKTNTTGAGKMRNPSRERLQNELAFLRKKVVEMEGELRVLQLAKRPNLSLIGSEMTNRGDKGASARVWQRIAQRQAQGRNAAEEENRRLKTVLEGQIQLAQRLEQVLHKRPNVSVFGDGEGYNKRLCIGGEDPTRMYDLFLSELDGLYARMDSLFLENGMETSVDDTLREAYVKTRTGAEGQDELYAELQDVNVLPFEFERVSSAMCER